MSLRTNHESLVSTHRKILTLRNIDTTKGIKSEAEALENALALYVRYVRLTNAFKRCYDTVIQPQKRTVVEKILECLMGRVLELRQDIISLDKRSFRLFNNLAVFRMNPSDLELSVPVWPRSNIEIERYNKCQELLSEWRAPQAAEKEVITFDDCDHAVVTIQRMERARQVRNRIIRKLQNTNISCEDDWRDMAEMYSSPAITALSEGLRVNKEKEESKKHRLAELQTLGMVPYTDKPERTYLQKLMERQEETRRLQAEKLEEYLEALTTIKEDIYNSESTFPFGEALEDEIRDWYLDFREKTSGEFPIFPTIEQGGSLAIYNTEIQELLKSLKQKGKIHKRRHKLKIRKSKKKTGKEVLEKERLEYMRTVSEFGPALDSVCKEFNHWIDHDESKFKTGISHDVHLIRVEKLKEVETEIRLKVDEEMRIELDNLRLARDKDMKRTHRARKKAKQKKKRKRKKKKAGKAMDFETICQSLINDGLLKLYPKIYYRDILGEYNIAGMTEREGEFIPFLADVKLVLNELCTLPLCSEFIHSKAPFVRSVAVVGPPGVSKKTLLYAVCTESNAVLIDFSMKTVTENYPGRTGVRVLMKTLKVFASLMQPLVLAIYNTEEMFTSKGGFSKAEKRSMCSSVKRFMKWLKRNDRVLVFGISDQPYRAKASKFASVFKKIFYVRPPEYGTRLLLWRDVIAQCSGILAHDFPLSILSFLSDGYNKKEMEGICKKILTPRRLTFIENLPLDLVEFLPFFSEYTPVYRKEANAFEKWMSKIPPRCR